MCERGSSEDVGTRRAGRAALARGGVRVRWSTSERVREGVGGGEGAINGRAGARIRHFLHIFSECSSTRWHDSDNVYTFWRIARAMQWCSPDAFSQQGVRNMAKKASKKKGKKKAGKKAKKKAR
jgi:hypothetical protein